MMEYFSTIKRNGELVVQWLGLYAFAAEGPGSISGPGPRILQVRWYAQTNKQEEWSIDIYYNMDELWKHVEW